MIKHEFFKPIRVCLLVVLLAPAWLSISTTALANEAVDFTLRELGGDDVSISDYRGDWVVIDYWATWCEPSSWRPGSYVPRGSHC